MAKLEELPGISSRGARRARGMRVSSSLAEINVVPLVDVMLVLLVIFMVAAPMMQQGFSVQLPQVRKAAPLETTPITVIVPLSFHNDRRVSIGQDRIPLDVLAERVRQLLHGQLDRGVVLAGDGGVTLQDVASVFEALLAGGVQKVGLQTQPPKRNRRRAVVTETVSEVLQLRLQGERGFGRVLSGSFAVHVAGLVVLFAAHAFVVTHRPPAPHIMTITMGGSAGPRSTGMTAAGARPIEEVAPEPKHEPVRTAASKPDVMTLPVKSEPKHVNQVDQNLPVTAAPKPPTVGPQVTRGTSLAETGARTTDTGLTVGGAGVKNVGLEITDFCCPDYLQTVLQRIENNWNKNSPERGAVTLRFTIERDGRIDDNITVDQSDSNVLYLQSLSALKLARLPPLPTEFKGDHLVIHLRFPYGID